MNHPEELLAGHADGTLTVKERAAVDAHLATCERCPEELALASRAIMALSDLPEEPVPFGLTTRVVTEASRPSPKPERTPWTARLQWAAGLAAAAALVTVVALNLSNAPGSSNEAAPAAGSVQRTPAQDTMKGAAASPVPVEVQKIDYTETTVEQLATSFAPSEITVGALPSGAGLERSTAVVACVSKGVGDGLTANDSLARLIDASFHGTPAYLAVFLQSPGADQPPAKVVVWIVAKSDCSFLSYAFKRITP
jgi:anti-sigma factor ChrR (cupin superfamily)